jgi:hypothetical protein
MMSIFYGVYGRHGGQLVEIPSLVFNRFSSY